MRRHGSLSNTVGFAASRTQSNRPRRHHLITKGNQNNKKIKLYVNTLTGSGPSPVKWGLWGRVIPLIDQNFNYSTSSRTTVLNADSDLFIYASSPAAASPTGQKGPATDPNLRSPAPLPPRTPVKAVCYHPAPPQAPSDNQATAMKTCTDPFFSFSFFSFFF